MCCRPASFFVNDKAGGIPLQNPLLTGRFESALVFACRIHQSQTRKGTDVPYISHLLAVCALVLEYGGDEDQSIAALLHDAPEDQGGQGTLDRIRDEFGPRVAALVSGSGEPVELKGANWQVRKETFLRNLPHAPCDAMLIVAADKLHNLTCLCNERRILGDAIFSRFNGGKDGTLWYYSRLAEILARHLPVSLADRLTQAVHMLQSAC